MSVDRVTALIELHDLLRDELDRLRAGGPADLLAHCAAFCSAVTRHHTDEDTSVFGELRRAEPALGPVLDELERDHGLIARQLRALDPARPDFGTELDTLAALLETHFTYEERTITAALTALP